MNKEDWGKILHELRAAVHPENRGFKSLDEWGGERHGSWVWICFKTEGKGEEQQITRNVSFALTEEGPTASSFLVEITAGADDSIRFHRLLCCVFTLCRAGYAQATYPERIGTCL